LSKLGFVKLKPASTKQFRIMNVNKIYWFILLVLLLLGRTERIIAQQHTNTTTRAIVINGDTIPYIELKTVTFLAPRQFANNREQVRYTRLVNNVKRVYPYARLAGIKYEEYNRLLAEMPEAKRRNAAKTFEQQIKEEFEGDLKRLTFSQGHILIKLIDRETQHTSYEVVKDFRGSFSAVFWQSFGRLFGYNLKTQYDPTGEDKLIEEIVLLIEQGLI
jgi:hypothetical protein